MPVYRLTDAIPKSSAPYFGLLLIWLATTAMHIPDGYLSPVTSAIMFLLVLPFWVSGIRKLRQGMNTSRKSRVVGRLSAAEQRRIMAAAAATLLSKSMDMSSEVYLAMKLRGLHGRVVMLKPFKMKRRDWVWGGVLLSVSLAAIVLGR